MSAFAYANASTGKYDLGPPMEVVSERTDPNTTVNPAWELSYWKWGLEAASEWMVRMSEDVPSDWTAVSDGLAELPVADGVYILCEG